MAGFVIDDEWAAHNVWAPLTYAAMRSCCVYVVTDDPYRASLAVFDDPDDARMMLGHNDVFGALYMEERS